MKCLKPDELFHYKRKKNFIDNRRRQGRLYTVEPIGMQKF